MPFEPSKPAPNSPNSSQEMRDQLTALFVDLQQRISPTDLFNAIAGTSNNTNGVGALGELADPSYNSGQMQNVLNKLDELIQALRR